MAAQGCDTGFGHMLAVQLVARGYRVFAGCLTPEGIEALQAETQNSDKLTAFKLDVTKKEDIAASADRIRASCPDGLEYGAPLRQGSAARRPHGSLTRRTEPTIFVAAAAVVPWSTTPAWPSAT